MRVLFLTGRAADGGSERFVSSLAAELSARGHECLLVYDEPGLLSEELAAGGTECIRLGLGRRDALRAPAELARIIKEKKIETKNLSCISLCGSNRNFRTCKSIDNIVCLAAYS